MLSRAREGDFPSFSGLSPMSDPLTDVRPAHRCPSRSPIRRGEESPPPRGRSAIGNAKPPSRFARKDGFLLNFCAFNC